MDLISVDVNWLVIIVVVIAVLALLVFIIMRNRKDKKDLNQTLNQVDKPLEHDSEDESRV